MYIYIQGKYFSFVLCKGSTASSSGALAKADSASARIIAHLDRAVTAFSLLESTILSGN